MPTDPELDHLRALDRAMAWSALAAGIAWPVVLVARSAPYRSLSGSVLAASSFPLFVALIVVGYVAARLGGGSLHRRAGAGAMVAAALLGLYLGWNAIVRAGLLDPTGLGAAAPRDAPVLLVLVACLASLAAGAGWPAISRRWSTAITARAARAATPAAIVVALVASVVARNSPVAALTASLAAAVAVVLGITGCAPVRTSGGRHAPMNNVIGAAVGLACCTPGVLQLVARQQPERFAVVDGATRLSGPLVPTMMWVAVVAACIGILAVNTIALASRQLGRLVVRPMSTRLFAPSVLALGLLLRVAALLTVNDARRDAGDPFFYHATANLLAHGRGFIEPVTWVASGGDIASALHGPAFPAVLSFWSRLGGTGYFDQQMASIVLGLPQIAAAIMLGHLLLGRRAAVLAGLLVVVYPNIWLTDGTLFVEGLMAGFTTLATWCAYRWRDTPRRRWIIALGLLIGLAALTRGEALLLVPLLLVPLVATARRLGRRERLRQALLGIAACLAALAPWMIYNTPRFEVFVPLSTNSNEVLFYANCDEVYSGQLIGFWSFACQTRHRELYGEPPGDQAQKAVYWRQQGLDYAADHWERLPKVIAARIGRQWEVFRPSQTVDLAFVELRPRAWVQAGQYMYYALMALAAVGTWTLRRRRRASWLLWVQAVAVTLTAAYAYGTLRFRAPFEPILCVLAAAGLVGVHDLWRSRGRAGDVAAVTAATTSPGSSPEPAA